MSLSDSPAAASRAPSAPIVQTIGLADLTGALGDGWRDFRRAPFYGLFFGAVYALGGWLIIALFGWLDRYYLGYPSAMGFALIAPFVAAGTYEVSRRLEVGEALSPAAVLADVWERAGKGLGALALVSLFTLVIWVDFAWFLMAMIYGIQLPSLSGFLGGLFTTPRGLAFLVIGNGVGALIAFAVFSITLVSPTLMVEREIDFVTAMVTSVRAVIANPRVLLVWTAIIGISLAFCVATGFLALLVVLPVLGHASWSMHRRLIAPARP